MAAWRPTESTYPQERRSSFPSISPVLVATTSFFRVTIPPPPPHDSTGPSPPPKAAPPVFASPSFGPSDAAPLVISRLNFELRTSSSPPFRRDETRLDFDYFPAPRAYFGRGVAVPFRTIISRSSRPRFWRLARPFKSGPGSSFSWFGQAFPNTRTHFPVPSASEREPIAPFPPGDQFPLLRPSS